MANNFIHYDDFSVEQLSQYMIAKDWKNTWNYLYRFVESLSPKINQSGNLNFQKAILSSSEGTAYANELGGIIGEIIFSLITNPDVSIPDEEFYHLIYSGQIIHLLFARKGINPDAVIEDILKKNKKPSILLQKKVLLLIGLETNLDIVKTLKKIDTKYRVIAISSYLAHNMLYTEKSYNNKIALYKLRNDLEKIGVNNRLILTLLSPYFTSSYMNHPEKHDVKYNINNAFLNDLRSNKKHIDLIKRQVLPAVSEYREKPKILVFMEFFAEGHAMTRSYGRWIQSLEKDFDVVVLCENIFEKDHINKRFDNVIFFDGLKELLTRCFEQSPDILILPSIGMTFWSIYMSNLRIAPIQMMMLGHPATTHSKNIDYVYGQSALYDERAFPNDVFIEDNSPYQFTPHHQLEQVLKRPIYSRQAGDKSPLKVSIIGSEVKIIHPFLEILRDIRDQSDFEIEFSFYVGAMSYGSLHMEEQLKKDFKNCHFKGWQPFEDYMQSIANSDIILNPFPFGHTNTVIDTLLLGKPCVGLKGVEPSSRTEKYILETVGLDHLFLADSEEDYKNKFHNIAKKILAGETEFYDRRKIHDVIYSSKPNVDVSKNVKWIFDNHQKMQNLKRKYYTLFENLDDES